MTARRRRPAAGPLTALRRALRLAFDFHGRATRPELNWFLLAALLATGALVLLDTHLSARGVTYPYARVLLVLVWVPWPALMVRRLHDLGRSGWVVLISLIPGIGAIMTLWLMLARSQDKAARDTANPRSSRTAFVLTLLLLAVVARYEPFTIPSTSMEPGLLPGDYMLADTLAYGWPCFGLCGPGDRFGTQLPDRGDVLVFRHPVTGAAYVKRLIGLPGEDLQLTGGVVHIDGAALPAEPLGTFSEPMQRRWGSMPLCANAPVAAGQPCDKMLLAERLPEGRLIHVFDTGTQLFDDTAPYDVPAGHLFLLGDNRDNSSDSRIPQSGGGLGFVPTEALIGRAALVAWSVSDGPWFNLTALRGDRFFRRVQ